MSEDQTVLIQVIKVYRLNVPEGTKDPIAWAYGLQSTEIAETGQFVDVSTDHAEVE